jgi:hypothetical protein
MSEMDGDQRQLNEMTIWGENVVRLKTGTIKQK